MTGLPIVGGTLAVLASCLFFVTCTPPSPIVGGYGGPAPPEEVRVFFARPETELGAALAALPLEQRVAMQVWGARLFHPELSLSREVAEAGEAIFPYVIGYYQDVDLAYEKVALLSIIDDVFRQHEVRETAGIVAFLRAIAVRDESGRAQEVATRILDRVESTEEAR